MPSSDPSSPRRQLSRSGPPLAARCSGARTSPPPSATSTLSSPSSLTSSPRPLSISRTTRPATQYHDPDEAALRDRLLVALHKFELGQPPDPFPLQSLLSNIGISDATSCHGKIKYLEEQILSQEEDTDLLLFGGFVALLQRWLLRPRRPQGLWICPATTGLDPEQCRLAARGRRELPRIPVEALPGGRGGGWREPMVPPDNVLITSSTKGNCLKGCKGTCGFCM